MADEIKITINILSRNRKERLARNLEALTGTEFAHLPLRMVVVDNASTDGSPDMVAERFPDVTLLRSEKNLGIAGWNLGFAETTSPWVLVLDDDACVSAEVLESLVKTLALQPQCAAVSCRIINPESGYCFTDEYPSGRLCFWGCCVLIRGESLRAVGGFDENIFLYAHEFEYALRLYGAGYTIAYCPDLTAWHWAKPSGRYRQVKAYYHTRNTVYAIAKYFSGRRRQRGLLARTMILPWYLRNGPSAFARATRAFRDGLALAGGIRTPLPVEVQDLYLRHAIALNPHRLVLFRDRFYRDHVEYYPGYDGAN